MATEYTFLYGYAAGVVDCFAKYLLAIQSPFTGTAPYAAIKRQAVAVPEQGAVYERPADHHFTLFLYLDTGCFISVLFQRRT